MAPTDTTGDVVASWSLGGGEGPSAHQASSDSTPVGRARRGCPFIAEVTFSSRLYWPWVWKSQVPTWPPLTSSQWEGCDTSLQPGEGDSLGSSMAFVGVSGDSVWLRSSSFCLKVSAWLACPFGLREKKAFCLGVLLLCLCFVLRLLVCLGCWLLQAPSLEFET